MSLKHPLALLALLLPVVALAGDKATDAAAEKAIRDRLTAAMKGVQIDDVRPAAGGSLYEVVLDGGEVAYTTADGRFLLSGDLYRVDRTGLVNLTEERQAQARVKSLADVPAADMVTFAPKGKPKAEIYVFTDPDCGYCRKLHNEVPALTAAGVAVHYLAFPRSGPAGETARKMEGIWCAPDRQAAMTEAKRGKPVPPAAAPCQSPVAEQYRLGAAVGVRGTPAVYTADGRQLGGYVPAAELLQQLGLR